MTDPREFFKQWPAFYYFIAVVFGPLLRTGLSAHAFLKKYPSAAKIVNLGSGPKIIDSSVTNVDMTPYPGVSLVADVCAVPLPDGSVARIISNTVLEHVRDPEAAVKEMHRLLEKGGIAYITVPFLYPFHSSPSDYHRWTCEGVRELFRDFEIVEIGVWAGPASALTAYFCHFVGMLFSFRSEFLNSLFTNLAMFIFFPLKFLDLILARLPQAHTVASIFYCVVKKS